MMTKLIRNLHITYLNVMWMKTNSKALTIGFIIGLVAGLMAGYAVALPQISELRERVDAYESKISELESQIEELEEMMPSVSGKDNTCYGAVSVKVVNDRWVDTSSLRNFGESATRLMNARTNEEKAVAIWRFIQQCTGVTGTVPKEPAYGLSYIADPMKLLNVYGAHWCDGLSRIMIMTWRSMGYRAEKFYKWGHTLADCWWRDEDEVDRWHLFDVSQHWFVYDRSGTHIASADEIMLDYSLISIPSKTPIPDIPSGFGLWSYVHAGHLNWPNHSMLLNFRPGESFTRLWGNIIRPYYNVFLGRNKIIEEKARDFEHGPYPLTYGNGILIYKPDLSKSSFKKRLFREPKNLATTEEDGKSPNLHPATPGKPGIAIIRISSPYIISDAWISGKFVRNTRDDKIIISISIDGGKHWKEVYRADKTGIFSIEKHSITTKFNPDKNYPPGLITPFGHYSYLLKIKMEAANEVSDCGIYDLSITTITQHNIFSLPQLWPGKNIITVTGEIAPDTSLRITYVWDDLMGKERRNVAIVESTPYRYEILTDGEKWEDVICKSITIEAIPRIGKGNFIEVKEKAPKVLNNITPMDAFPTEKIIGSSRPKPLKTVEEYIEELQEAIPRHDKVKTRNALWGLMALGRSAYKAKDVIINVIYKDISDGFYNKIYACQALYQVAGDEAASTLIKVLERDPQISWGDPTGRYNDVTLWLHTCASAASILARISTPEAKNAADLIADFLDPEKATAKIGFTPNDDNVWRWGELRWAFIKALGKLGSPKHGVILRKILLSGDGDTSALAARALGEIGDVAAVPDLLHILEKHVYQPQGLYAIESLGKLGNATIAPKLYHYLNHSDEDYRGFAAEALGKLGNKDAIPYLEALLERETFSWVKDACIKSISLLKEK